MKKKILTVDDSRTIRNMLLVTLTNAGYDTVQAEDGIGFIAGVRKNDRYRAIPILVLTTESDPEKKNQAREAGATGWIVKPFDPAKLIAAIERVTA
jgi:two-component system chemotaxis response regulator CheY